MIRLFWFFLILLLTDYFADGKNQQSKKDSSRKKSVEIPKLKGFSPNAKGLTRDITSKVELTKQVYLKNGTFWFGTQLTIGNKLIPNQRRDGANSRRKTTVAGFSIDIHSVSNAQFIDFIEATKYKTEAELFEWSFVLDSLVSPSVAAEVDGKNGYGRVKDATHWMAVKQASWLLPYGANGTMASDLLDLPVVHVSYDDAVEYCAWAGNRRLPTEKEWEYAARGGRSKQNYPWGDIYKPNMMNIWDGPDFPTLNLLLDGYHGPAPVKSYATNDYGLYNMVGNVWEWVAGGTDDARILRGGSFIDSMDGRFNHIVMVSTRQENSGNSAASNVGFRCASSTIAAEHVIPTSKSKKDSNSVIVEL